jgi:hypothetical protein
VIKLLLDEHLSPEYRNQIQRREPEIVAWVVGDPGAPTRGTPDPAILHWCEEHHFVLLTNNRKSMPNHLATHLGSGRHVPGILVINPEWSFGALLD